MATPDSFPALVLRRSEYRENDLLLTVLSSEYGRMTVVIRGGKSLKNKNTACTDFLCYSELTVTERNGYYTLKEASLIEHFFGLRSHLDRFALASYVAEVLAEITVSGEGAEELLPLALNTLYLLSETTKEPALIKAVFELRAAAASGFCPDLSACALCGCREHKSFYLDVMNGTLRCGDCFGSEADAATRREGETTSIILPLGAPTLSAMRYVTSCSPKRIFSFLLPEEERENFTYSCEKYLLHQLERSFKTLDFYREIRRMKP